MILIWIVKPQSRCQNKRSFKMWRLMTQPFKWAWEFCLSCQSLDCWMLKWYCRYLIFMTQAPERLNLYLMILSILKYHAVSPLLKVASFQANQMVNFLTLFALLFLLFQKEDWHLISFFLLDFYSIFLSQYLVYFDSILSRSSKMSQNLRWPV